MQLKVSFFFFFFLNIDIYIYFTFLPSRPTIENLNIDILWNWILYLFWKNPKKIKTNRKTTWSSSENLENTVQCTKFIIFLRGINPSLFQNSFEFGDETCSEFTAILQREEEKRDEWIWMDYLSSFIYSFCYKYKWYKWKTLTSSNGLNQL